MKYFPEATRRLTQEEKRRTIVLKLMGTGVFVPLPLKNLRIIPGMIQYCFGAENVMAHTSPFSSEPLGVWLGAWIKYGDWCPLIGFSGPKGKSLFITFTEGVVG
ncbi:MAG: hypothetical protein HZA94_03710 [Candidatus Vogelbacteria bacterium]|nr:hypothetical protein [Candidatus Vogelbacteria bacterium]